MKRAVIFVYVWPEPRSSAAGLRTVELCQNLRGLGFEVTAVSPCKENEASADLRALGVETRACPANDTAAADALADMRPELVVYDRFVMEEHFGWKARELWPNALHVVDTQDLHTVRRAREKSGGMDFSEADLIPDLERELSSLYRSDACFVVSPWERDWLIEKGYPAERVCWLPFGAAKEEVVPGFEERDGFCFLGNFRHGPNLDTVMVLAKEIWPKIRAELPYAKLYLYGAYPVPSVSELDGKNGIKVVGAVRDHRTALMKHRALLAPIRFGAGIKGKLLEAWACGTAVAASAVAVEGTSYPATEDFVGQAVVLHSDKDEWEKARTEGYSALKSFDPENVRRILTEFLALAAQERSAWRMELTGRMLRHHLHNSTKYFSRWIEAKNRP